MDFLYFLDFLDFLNLIEMQMPAGSAGPHGEMQMPPEMQMPAGSGKAGI